MTRRVKPLEQDKISQTLEITKLKQMVKKLERRNKLKVSKLRRLKKGEIIANMDADEDVTLKDVAVVAKEVVVEKDVEIEENADVQGRQAESQAQIYQIDIKHANKVLSMQDDELEPVELKEVVKLVTTAKLMIEVVTAASATITVATTPITAATLTTAPSAARRRKGVVIRDPEETAAPSIIIHSKPKSKDKGKGIMVEEPKPLKKQAQIEQDEAYTRERKCCDEVSSIKEEAINKSPSQKEHDDLSEEYEMTKEHMEEEDIKALNKASESQAEKAAKKQKLDEDVEELKKHIQIVPNNEDDVYTEATPLARKRRFGGAMAIG
nr:hypothetical protein [Tanacetum cinerariifolium]